MSPMMKLMKELNKKIDSHNDGPKWQCPQAGGGARIWFRKGTKKPAVLLASYKVT